ncbi:hydrolase [Gordonibacter sp. An230]|nr:hydrolase [Gordonibacter sp. An230]
MALGPRRVSRPKLARELVSKLGLAMALAMALGLAGMPMLGCMDGRSDVAFADEPAEGGNAVNTQQLPDSSFIYDTSIGDLAQADSYYDNQTVQVVGEVVGDGIRSGLDDRHQWITLSAEGDSSTISAYMTSEQVMKIDTFGRYGARGTMLQVRGTFHLVCPDHDGISDLHAEVVTVVSRGEEMPDEFDAKAFVPGVVTVAAGLAMLGVFYWLRERQR